MSHSNPPTSSRPTDPKAGRRQSGRAQQDPIQDPYHDAAKHGGPAECPECGAVILQGRWQWGTVAAGAAAVLCPACRRIRDGVPAGIVTLSGSAVQTHADEMIRLADRRRMRNGKNMPSTASLPSRRKLPTGW